MFIVNYVPAMLRGSKWFFPYRPAKSLGRWAGASLLTFIRNILTGKGWWVRKKRMDSFRRDYLTEGSRAIRRFKALSRVDADILVVGSDQIWNPDVNYGFRPAYFGAFANPHIRKTVAYAASIGTASLPEEAEPEFSRLLEHVDEIYMRETSAAEYVEKRFGRRAVHVADPVFLLDSTRWRTMKDSPEEQGFILYYEAEYSAALREAAYELAKGKNLKVIELTNRWTRRRWRRWPFEIVYSAGPLQFLGYIDAASCVFTNSFHATAFSILLHKPFHVQNPSIAKARIESLLSSAGLSGYADKGTCRVGIDGEAGWAEVDASLKSLRERSGELLYNSLTRQAEND